MPRPPQAVVAAIPNYNMADSLHVLLPQVLQQDYDQVFVMDDASTDHTHDVVQEFGSAVTTVWGQENLGAGVNRNRILGALSREAIIHFIDADMRLESKRNPEIARDIMPREGVGFIGGLVLNPDGQQMGFNYGPRQCLRTDVGSAIQARVYELLNKNPVQAQMLYHRFEGLLGDWPDPFSRPEPRQVFWSSEANMLMSADVFRKLEGYDPDLRDHEIQELALRMYRHSLPRFFNPAVSALHTAVQVRKGNRNVSQVRHEWLIARKQGFSNWFLPEGRWRPQL
jgi:glycosyltransferase involved in cell wall biosynthesis